MLRVLAWSLLIPGIVSVYQLFTRTGLTFGDVANRIYGTFGHPNVLAYYLVVMIALLGVAFLAQTKDRQSRSWLVLGVISFLWLLSTSTRGAWLALCIVALVIGLLWYRKYVVTGLLVLLFLVFFAPTLNTFSISAVRLDWRTVPVVQRLTDFQSEDSSFDWRLSLWKEMKQRVYERPLLGYGLGTFPILRERETKLFFQGTEAHNDYLRLAVETGIVGLVAYLLLSVALITRMILVFRQLQSRMGRYCAIGALGLTLAFFVASLFDNMLQATPVMWVYWVVLGAVLALPTLERAERQDQK
jgi:O-antigen ligase